MVNYRSLQNPSVKIWYKIYFISRFACVPRLFGAFAWADLDLTLIKTNTMVLEFTTFGHPSCSCEMTQGYIGNRSSKRKWFEGVQPTAFPLMKVFKSYNPELRISFWNMLKCALTTYLPSSSNTLSVCLVWGLHLLHSHLILNFQDPEHTQEGKPKAVHRGSLRLYQLLPVPYPRLTEF